MDTVDTMDPLLSLKESNYPSLGDQNPAHWHPSLMRLCINGAEDTIGCDYIQCVQCVPQTLPLTSSGGFPGQEGFLKPGSIAPGTSKKEREMMYRRR